MKYERMDGFLVPLPGLAFSWFFGRRKKCWMDHVSAPACSVRPHPPLPFSFARKKQQQLLLRNQETRHRSVDGSRQQQQAQEESPPQDQPSTKKHRPKLTLRGRLSLLCKEGRLDAARRLLFDSLASAPHPTTLLWNTLLIGYACNSLPHETLRLYALMNSYPDHHACPLSDAYTYSSALKACADCRQLRLGKSIHCHLLRRCPSLTKNRVLNNSLLNMYASTLKPDETSHLDSVRLLFDRMPKRNVVAWNTLMAWYIRCRRPDDALAQFRLMLEVGMLPTPVSFISIFPAVAAIENKDYCDVLYGLLVKCGRDYLTDQFVISSAVLMYSELSDIQSARQIFDQAEEKNTQVWNTMIGGYVQNGGYSEALALFVQILESNVVRSDVVTCLSSLMAVSQLQDLRLGKQIHSYLIKENSSSLPLVLCNALIVMYSRCGEIQLASEFFQQMPQRDVVSWNTMVSAFVQHDFSIEGVLLVYEMQNDGFLVDSVTATALLSAASDLASLTVGRETHGYLIRHGIDFEGMESYLIDMYAKSGSVEVARRLFGGKQSDDRDKATWNAMIAGYTQSGKTEEAMAVFKDMLKEYQQIPNAVTLASVLPACSPVGGAQAGQEIHGFAIRRCLDNNVFVSTALLDMYSRCGQISLAERIFDGMAEKGTVTYTTMLSGFGQHGLGEKALALFRSMKESGVKPDAITFVALISACSYSGLVDEGLAVYKSMQDFGLVAAPEHHCCVVDLLGRAGRVEEAYEFAKGLGANENFPGIWGSLLAACRVHRKFQLGELVADRVFALGLDKELSGYHVLLSNVYAAERNWDNVDKVRKEMRERGLRKEPGSSWIEVGDSSHRFMSRDQMHPENDRIHAMLQGLALEMKSPGVVTLEPPYLADEVSDCD